MTWGVRFILENSEELIDSARGNANVKVAEIDGNCAPEEAAFQLYWVTLGRLLR